MNDKLEQVDDKVEVMIEEVAALQQLAASKTDVDRLTEEVEHLRARVVQLEKRRP